MPRINRAIELLEQGENLYYTATGPLTYENGKAQAKTWADFLITDFEHNPFDVVGLKAFMKGLVDGGPTNSGHRMPTVMSTLPSNARTEAEVHANAWQIRQVLGAGVHGILHTHARQADAVRAFVESCRYPFQKAGVGKGLGEGQRGAGGQREPAETWGVSPVEYTKIADPWPLNPNGELLLGLKLEDRECVANARYICKTPGLAFAEWGPGDMGMSYGYEDAHDPPYPPELDAARNEIKKACDDNGLFFLSSWNDRSKSVEENVQFLRDWGARIFSGGGEEQAKAGRKLTNRKMPV
ncbi:MAG: aldolase/citrate lyase family protein [Dehalococcoidia bacterium]